MAAKEVSLQAMIWFRCILVGLVTTFIGTCLYAMGMMAWGMASISGLRPNGQQGGEVGWDVVSMWHNVGIEVFVLPAIFFIIGFLLAYRSYSRLSASRRA
ncbi:MAG: hypothetical protein ACRD5R_00515 [Candidatus Acidiferrales bacterium]